MWKNTLIVNPHTKYHNPYREGTLKHKKWNSLVAYVESHMNATVCVYDVISNTSYIVSDLWKEARLNHVSIQLFSSSTPCNVLDYFDNIRKQWEVVQVLYGDSDSVVLSIKNDDNGSTITTHELCSQIEQFSSQEWCPNTPESSEWSFVIYDSHKHTLLNTTESMTKRWWSLERFAHHLHDYSTVCSVRVYPCVFDEEIKHDIGLSNNRIQSVSSSSHLVAEHSSTTLSVKPNDDSSALRKQQDEDYNASLAIDRVKTQKETESNAKSNSECAVSSCTLPDSNAPQFESNDIPLTREELRLARCAFFSNQT